jgi:hypothetical protein
LFARSEKFVRLRKEVVCHGCLERSDRGGQLRDLAEDASGLQVPCFVNDLLCSIDGCLEFTLAQVSGGADGAALRTSTAMAGQAQPDRL